MKRTFTEAAEYIGMSKSFLRVDRMNGHLKNRTPGPDYIKFGKSVRYLKKDRDGWLLRHRVKQS